MFSGAWKEGDGLQIADLTQEQELPDPHQVSRGDLV